MTSTPMTMLALAAFVICLENVVPGLTRSSEALFGAKHLVRAACDNAAHAAVAAATWIAVRVVAPNVPREPTLSTFLTPEAAIAAIAGSAIDLDHFIAAGSLSLRAATGLRRRPFAHSTAFVLVAPSLALAAGATWTLAVLLATAVASHQARDALRRGFWLASTWSTPPISRPTYVAATVSLALLAAASLRNRPPLAPDNRAVDEPRRRRHLDAIPYTL